MPTPAAAKSNEDDAGDDLQFLGRTGKNALSDFPHSRENCLEHPWKPGAEKACCPNCFCYVCDTVASSCPEWSEHCKATHSQKKWQDLRAAWKRHGGKPPAAATTPSTASSSSIASRYSSLLPSATARTRLSTADATRWSAEKLLRATERVYPVEHPNPPGLAKDISLRPYQRQSLAFMLNLEASTEYRLKGFPHGAGSPGIRGGWLADEMGMGKTAVCVALVLAARPYTKGLTVVACNNTLVGQWMDEIQRFAPGLKVAKYYGSSKQVVDHSTDIVVTTPHSKPADIVKDRCRRLILDESHLYEHKSDPKLPTSVVSSYQRAEYIWCVTGTPFSTTLTQLMAQANLLGHWSSGVRLNHAANSGEAFYDDDDTTARMTNEKIVERLQSLMIRHSKAQRIHGEVALALPDADCETVWLEMNEEEKALYSLAACADGIPKWADTNRMTDTTLADVRDGLGKRRNALAGLYDTDTVTGTVRSKEKIFSLTRPGPGSLRPAACAAFRRIGDVSHRTENRIVLPKYAALLKDIDTLKEKERSVSVVVFTHHNEVFHELKGILEAHGCVVYAVSRQTNPEKRHNLLRKFQAGDPRPGARVFLTTFGTAAVGLTLTAASRVYLMESSIDPSQEAQAAGRIHRLGQTKEVLVKRFMVKDTLDAAVDALHKQIKAGGLTLDGGRFPKKALDVFRSHGVTDPHHADPDAEQTESQRRYRSTDKYNVARHGGDGGFDYGKTVMTKPCAHCGRAVEVPGTSVWWGKGRWVDLNGVKDDHPSIIAHMDTTDSSD